MNDWLDHLVRARKPQAASTASEACVLISTVHTQGSCPREAGTRMLVTETQCIGTIGGGRLELQAIEAARTCLQNAPKHLALERYALGARLGQCCGGAVQLAFEYLPADGSDWIDALARLHECRETAVLVTPGKGTNMASSQKLLVTANSITGSWSDTTLQSLATGKARELLVSPNRYDARWVNPILYEKLSPETFPIAVFGAGHVGKALVQVLAALPCHINWIDNRAEQFPATTPDNVHCKVSEDPEDEVDALPLDCHVFIMTHDHALDLVLCEACLNNTHLASCGLIGSATKRTLFERRLKLRGIDDHRLKRLTCPIGIAGIDGKHPSHIAIAVAAELLQSRQTTQSISHSDEKVASCP